MRINKRRADVVLTLWGCICCLWLASRPNIPAIIDKGRNENLEGIVEFSANIKRYSIVTHKETTWCSISKGICIVCHWEVPLVFGKVFN